MQNLKVKMLSVAIAALTAATPILSSYVAYASDITVNDDGTVHRFLHQQMKRQTKLSSSSSI